MGLERLEYRGYDSAGISALSGGKITTVKHGGRVANLKDEAENLSGGAAIGHTRWATHGQPDDINAHPHVSGKFSVVHNGIIENWRDLKEELISRGVVFKSQTDSEVAVRLIDFYYSADPPSGPLAAVARAVKRLKGSFALAILCEDIDGIIAVKYKSPIVVGYGADGIFVCSDIPALPKSVKTVCVPEDGDIVSVRSGKADIFDFDLRAVNRVRRRIVGAQLTCGKGDYPHFMVKEIGESERTVRDTCESFFSRVDLKKLSGYVKNADKIILTGCGTAYNAGLVARRFFEDNCAAVCQVEIAGELRYALPRVTGATLVFAISQSGETADTIEAVRALKEKGARVVAVTNCGYSAITRIADLVVPVCAGAEVCVAATKSYIGQLAALYLISSLTGDAFAAKDELLAVCPAVGKVVKDFNKSEEIARVCASSRAVFFLGRGIDYAVAVEASLKLKEVSYVFSDGYPAGELKHGTLALIDGDTLSVVIICDEKLAEKCENAVAQVQSRGGKVAVITSVSGVAERQKGGCPVWEIPKCPPNLSPFVSAICAQLIAYRAAILLNRDPDKPRNLAKSVTVE